MPCGGRPALGSERHSGAYAAWTCNQPDATCQGWVPSSYLYLGQGTGLLTRPNFTYLVQTVSGFRFLCYCQPAVRLPRDTCLSREVRGEESTW